MDTFTLNVRGASVTLDLVVGHIADLTFEVGGRRLTPLHRAPWIDEPVSALPHGLPAGQARLSGDFLCAPFSASDIEPAPLHGWPANSRWDFVAEEDLPDGKSARFRLARPVMGATVEKTLTLRDGHAFLYQEHRFIGGTGAIPVAHHPMTSMAAGGRLAFSAKRYAATPPQPLEPDPKRAALAYPARSTDLSAFPAAGGGTYDLTQYPSAGSHEDFVTLVEEHRDALGWTAVARAAEADIVLVMKDPVELPVTMLWISNGGRDYAPWNGRHRGVLGIEDGRTAVGHTASLGDNSLKRDGVETAFALSIGSTVAIRHVIGALPAASDGAPPVEIVPTGGELHLRFAQAGTVVAAFDGDFLG